MRLRGSEFWDFVTWVERQPVLTDEGPKERTDRWLNLAVEGSLDRRLLREFRAWRRSLTDVNNTKQARRHLRTGRRP